MRMCLPKAVRRQTLRVAMCALPAVSDRCRAVQAVRRVVLVSGVILSLGLFGHAADPPTQTGAAPTAEAAPAAEATGAPAPPGQPAGGETTATPAGQPGAAEAPADEAPEEPAPPLPVQAPTEEKPAVAPVVIKYDQLEVSEEVEKEQRKQKNPVLGMLKNKKFGPGQQQVFDTYYKEYALRRWADNDYRNQLPKFRAELASELKRGKGGPVHDYLLGLVMPFFIDLAKKDYDPVVRCNAMLMIGDLNAVDSVTVKEPTVPYPDALPVLLEAITDENQIDAVKMAALPGIIRHAELDGIDPQRRDQVVDAMLQLATTKAVAGRSADGQAWARARAAEALGALKVADPQGKIHGALADIVIEKETPFLTRCEAAQALGKLDYRAAGAVDPVRLASRLGQLAADACQGEIDAELPELGGGTVGRMAYRYSGDEEDDEEGDYGYAGQPFMTQVDQAELLAKQQQAPIFRRRLKSRLLAAWEGICGDDPRASYVRWRPEGTEPPQQGVYVAATDPSHEAFMKELLARLKELMTVCDDKENEKTYDDLVAQVQEELGTLNQLLARGPTVGGAAQPAGAAAQ